MAMNEKLTQVAATIKKVIEAHLAPADVTEIHLSGDLDHDGDPILKVEIVFEAEGDHLDPVQVKSLIRHLREPLDDFSEIGFPVLSFVTAEEYSPEAA